MITITLSIPMITIKLSIPERLEMVRIKMETREREQERWLAFSDSCSDSGVFYEAVESAGQRHLVSQRPCTADCGHALDKLHDIDGRQHRLPARKPSSRH